MKKLHQKISDMKNFRSFLTVLTILLIGFVISCAKVEKPSESDIDELTNLITNEFKKAWDANDEELIAAMFLEEADLAFPTSNWIKGRDDIRQAFDIDLAEGRAINIEIEDIRFLTPAVSIVNVNAHISGGINQDGNKILDYWDSATMTMKKENGEWKYAALRVLPARIDYKEVEAKIDNTWNQFKESAEGGDLDGVMSCFTENTLNMVPGMSSGSHEETSSLFESFFSNNSATNISKETLELEVVGPKAYELGLYTDIVTPKNGETYNRKFRYLVVWQMEPDGNWRWHRFIFNNLPAE
ncbi:MAG: YybH family protein [Cyclobacteriaceae bacterium]